MLGTEEIVSQQKCVGLAAPLHAWVLVAVVVVERQQPHEALAALALPPFLCQH